MIEDPDIVRAARLLIGKYGERAVVVAAERARSLVEDGQRAAGALWLRIGVRAQELVWEQRKRP